MSSANTILKNNRSLLRKKRMFDKENHTELHAKKGLKKETYETKKVSEKELRALRKNQVKETLKERKYRLILVAMLLCAFSFLCIQFFHVSNDKQKQAALRLEIYHQKLGLGDRCLLQNNFNQAIVHYKAATKAIPERFLANYKLLKIYASICSQNQNNCDDTLEFLDDLYERFPDKKKELRIVYNSLPIEGK